MAFQAKGLDEDLGRRLCSLTRPQQRWLRTALHAVRGMESVEEEDVAAPAAADRPEGGSESGSRGEKFSAALEELLSGDITLEECIRRYPDLAEELRAVSDVAGLLRMAGEGRRRLGEDILKGFDPSTSSGQALGDASPEDEEGEEGEGASPA